MILAITGHRRIDENEPGELLEFARLFVALSGADHLITGMAIGWDQAVAQACVDLEVPFTAAIPFPQQADPWPAHAKVRWLTLVNAAARVNIGATEYRREALLERNRWMVDHSQALAAFLDPSRPPGGTFSATLYASKRGRRIEHLWDRWKSFQYNRRPIQ